MKINYLRNWKFAFELSETFAELNVKEKKNLTIILYSEARKYSQDFIITHYLIFLFCLYQSRHILFHHFTGTNIREITINIFLTLFSR